MLGMTMIGCSKSIVITEESTTEQPADYIIDADYKEGNALSTYNQVYQIGEWIYFAKFEIIYRINVNGNHQEKLFEANLGQIRGTGANGLTQCGQYLVFTQGSYIYKMNLTTLETEVLINGEDEYTCFVFDVKDDDIYFVGNEGSFMDGVYKININDDKPKRILKTGKGTKIWSLQIASDKIYYTVPYKGFYRIDLDGSSKKRILKAKHIGYEPFAVTDDYIFFINGKYELKRADIDGKNVIKLVDECIYFNIIDDKVVYTDLTIKQTGNNYYHYGTDIYKLLINTNEIVKICETTVDIFTGSSGNWIYFTEVESSDIMRIRLDGTGKMAMPK